MRNLRNLLRSSGWLKADKRRNDQSQRGQTTRRLSSEALERRELLAGDFAAAHNYYLPQDVDNNLRITPLDALAIINHLNRNGGQSADIGQGEEVKGFVDVNGDGRVTASDALSVINTLNRIGEGAGPELLEIQVSARDGNSAELAQDASGAYNVSVGQVFELEVGYLDLRDGEKIFTLPTNTPGQTVDVRFRQGVFQLVADIGVTNADGSNGASLIQPIISEAQQIKIGSQINDPTKELFLDITLTQAGATVSTEKVRVSATDFVADPAATLQSALEDLQTSGGAFVTAGNTVQVTSLPAATPGDFFLQVRFGGTASIGVNQPTITIQPIQNVPAAGAEFPFNNANVTNTEFRTDNVLQGVNSTGANVGQRYNVDYESRSLPNPNGGSFNFFDNRPAIGAFNPAATDAAQIFDNIGGLGPVVAGGVPETQGGDADTLDNTFDALSIPVFISAPVTGLKFQVTPGEDDNGESFLIYGFLEEPDAAGTDTSRPVPLDQVRFDADAVFTINATNPGTGPVTPTVSVSVAPAAVNEDGAGALVYTFTRTGDTASALTVNYGVGGTATSGTDFAALSGTVTIAAGQTTGTVSVNPTDDTTDEPNDTIILTVIDAAAYDLGTSVTATGTITNDDSTNPVVPVVTVAVSPASVNEDGSGALTYTFTRTGATTAALAVSYAVSGTATSGTDFTALSGTVSIPAGQASATVVVNPTDDTTPEPNDTIILTVTDTATYDVGTAGSATGTINDDDSTTTVPTVTLAVSPAAVNEDGNGTLTYTFTRSGSTTSALAVSYAVSGTATSGTDFTALSGTVTIPAGSSTATVTVNPTDDTAVEPNDTIILTITDTATYDLGATFVATGTITNDDSGTTTPVVSIAVAPAAVNEDGNGTLVYTFTRTGVTTAALAVNYTVSGTATSGTDFAALSGTVTIPAGSASATVSVNPTDDTTVEGNDTIILTVTDGAAYDVGTASATGTITNDDSTGPVTPTVSVSVSPAAVNEDGNGTLVYTFTRTGATTAALAVSYAVSGTATPGSDFTALSGTVTIPAGSASATVSVNPTDDTIVEANETIILTVTDTAAYDRGSTFTATGTVTNDDTGVGSTVTGALFIDEINNLDEVASSFGAVAPIRNGVKDSSEQALVGVRVELRSASGELLATTFSGMNGEYKFTGVPQGNYLLNFGLSSENVFLGSSNQVPLTVGAAGGSVAPPNLSVLGVAGSLSNLDILASSYTGGNGSGSSGSGRSGGAVALDASGQQIFFMASEGFENVEYGELLLNSNRDSALMTIVQDNQVKSALLTREDFVISRDGKSLQFFGGVDDLGFTSANSPLTSQGFSQAAIDALFARASQIAL